MSLDRDVIHPRNQGIGVDAEFIETWAERRLRRERERDGRRTDLPVHAKSQAKPYDADFERRFRQLYAAGWKRERIAVELGISLRSVGQYRKHFDLPYRTDKVAKPSSEHILLSVKIPADLDRAITNYCSGRHQSRAHFVRSLIIERLG